MFEYLFNSFGLVKQYDMPCIVESASLEPKYGNKFIAGGEDMWVHVFDFHTGEEVGKFPRIHMYFSYFVIFLFLVSAHNFSLQPLPCPCFLVCSLFLILF